MLYTLGTSNRTEAEFFAELVKRDVWLMVDVRSSPRSRNPWANRTALECSAVRHGIQYAWCGAILGGLNPIVTTEREFVVSVESLVELTQRGSVAIFCAEGDPRECHRSYKVGASLLIQHGFDATNILRDGSDESVRQTLARTILTRVPVELRGLLL